MPPAPTVAIAPESVPPGLLAEPTFEECHAEWLRYCDDLSAGRLNDWDVPDGHFVAYHGGRVRGHDADATALRGRIAAALRVHPARLVIDYPWMW